mmetsp:Transcript_65201/g.121550  ORF Transcript_65201/g.121550 Transcript_65201/m.121550 type:complete len:137 (-) Transcript_65201:257-667(-)
MGCGASARRKYKVPECLNAAPKILKEPRVDSEYLPEQLDPDANINDAFREIDEDDNGIITEDEIESVVKKPPLGLALSNEQIADMLAGVAHFVDGKVDRMDFVNAYWARLMVVTSPCEEESVARKQTIKWEEKQLT